MFCSQFDTNMVQIPWTILILLQSMVKDSFEYSCYKSRKKLESWKKNKHLCLRDTSFQIAFSG